MPQISWLKDLRIFISITERRRLARYNVCLTTPEGVAHSVIVCKVSLYNMKLINVVVHAIMCAVISKTPIALERNTILRKKEAQL